MKETYIKGKKVKYEENASGGADYLMNHLDEAEARVFFDQAKSKNKIRFEDAQGKNYFLIHNDSDFSYTIEKKNF
jgi:hypothetical protein